MMDIAPVEEWHLSHVANNMRPEDFWEVHYSSGKTPHEALRLAGEHLGRQWSLLWDGVPIAIFGVSRARHLSAEGVPWLLGTTDIRRHPREFLAVSREVVQEMSRRHSYLGNFVHAKNAPAIRYLKRLGFQFIEDARIMGGEPFHLFYMEKQHV